MTIIKHDIAKTRTSYLHSIKAHRQPVYTVFYTDETWVNASHTAPLQWNPPDLKSKKYPYWTGSSIDYNTCRMGRKGIFSTDVIWILNQNQGIKERLPHINEWRCISEHGSIPVITSTTSKICRSNGQRALS